MIDTFFAFGGLAVEAVRTICGIQRAKKLDDVIKRLDKVEAAYKRLTADILYVRSASVIEAASGPALPEVTSARQIRQSLSGIQLLTASSIVATRLVQPPVFLSEALVENPWRVLTDTRPAEFAEQHPDPKFVPLLFEHKGVPYVGWQTSGVLESAFGCKIAMSGFPLRVSGRRTRGNKQTSAGQQQIRLSTSTNCIVCGKETSSYFRKYCHQCGGFLCGDCKIQHGFFRTRIYCPRCRTLIWPVE